MKYYVNLCISLPTSFTPGAKQGRGHELSTYNFSLVLNLSNTEVQTSPNHFHPFRLPVHMLKYELQGKKSYNEWD